MGSLELRAKSKEELAEWRRALELAVTSSASSLQESILETKKIYAEMSDVIQKQIDELQELHLSAANADDCRLGTALQVCRASRHLAPPLAL